MSFGSRLLREPVGEIVVSIVSALSIAACAPAVRVVDGDTIIVGSTHYRLWGIEAPDLNQDCADGWHAGAAARRTLADLIAGSRRIDCADWGRDPYRRVLGLCRADGQDLSAAMVSAGMAWAQASRGGAYREVERDAREQGRGLHAHDCLPVSEWRQSSR